MRDGHADTDVRRVRRGAKSELSDERGVTSLEKFPDIDLFDEFK